MCIKLSEIRHKLIPRVYTNDCVCFLPAILYNILPKKLLEKRAVQLPLLLQISSCFLFTLNGFKQGFKISFAKALCTLALYDLEKQSGSVFNRLGKNLQ